MNNRPEHLPVLNLPPFRPELSRTADGLLTALDPLRGKYVALTPEEWVRLHFTNWLTAYKGYPASLVVNELGLRLNGRLRRADTVVYDKCLKPLMVIEYKRASVSVTQKVFDQIVRYNMVFHAPYIAVSNGLTHYCCHIDFATRSYTFLKEFPDYNAISGEIPAE